MAKKSVWRKYGNPMIIEKEEAAAGSANAFYAGDLVQIDSSGELVIASTGSIWGIALKTATGTASTRIPVDVLSSNDIISVKYKAAATTEALANDVVDFTFTANGHTVDEGSATTDAIVVREDPQTGFATSGRLLVRIKESALQTFDVNK